MIVDKHGKTVLSNRAKRTARYALIRELLKKKIVLVGAFLSLITVGFSNLSAFVDFYEKFTDGPYIEIPVEIENKKRTEIVISNLLDVHISTAVFYSGRLMVEEQPTARVNLKPKAGSGSYSVPAGKTYNYSFRLYERRYEQELSSGAANVVFVLRLINSDRFYYIEEKFHKSALKPVIFKYSIQ